MTDYGMGPILTAYIVFEPDTPEARLFELRVQHIPRVGEGIWWEDGATRIGGWVQDINWVYDDGETGVYRVRHVNLIVSHRSVEEQDEE
jgi:hypothetical protein